MPVKFNVDILEFQKINKIENAWSATDYKALLDSMGLGEDDLDSISSSDLKEMCLMSLADFEPHEAANYVMSYLINDGLTVGKIDQISHDMIDDRLWEQFADLSYHERFFNAYEFLREAYNGTFAQPTGVKFQVKISSKKRDDLSVFEVSLESALTRLLAKGLDDNAVINRLYEEQIDGENFEEAENILWQIKALSQSENEVAYEIITSAFWFGGLEDVESFEALTHADVKASEEE
jgi:hypothetical protein